MSSYPTLNPEIYQPNKKNVGVFIRNLSHSVPQLEWAGMAGEAEKQNINLFCFTGSSVSFFKNTFEQVKTILNLLHSKKFDGFVLWLSLIDNMFAQEEKKLDIIKKFQQIPCVTGESSFPGIPAIVHSHYEGMRELVSHCIEVHGYRRIAFIQGPKGHLGARERYRAFCDTLAAHGIKLEPLLVTPNVEWGNGEYAGSLLLKQIGNAPPQLKQIDCIVCAATSLSIGVLSFLQKLGISVPHDIAVTGYDDTLDAQLSSPSITTIKTPLREMGICAVRCLVDQFERKKSADKIELPGKLVIRESCGCNAAPLNLFPVMEAGEPDNAGFNVLDSRLIQKIVLEEEYKMFGDIGRILDLFIQVVQSNKNDDTSFFKEFDLYLLNPGYESIDILKVQKILILLHDNIKNSLNQKMRQRADLLLEKAVIFTGEKTLWRSEKELWKNRVQNEFLRDIETSLLADITLRNLFRLLLDKLPSIGIQSCFMVLFEGTRIPHEWARLIFAFNESGEIQTGPSGLRFPGDSIVPMGLVPLSRQLKMIVEPIAFENRLVGQIIFEMPQPEGPLYETLGIQISSALMGILPFEVKEQKALLSKRLNKEFTRFIHVFSHPLMEPLRKILSFGERVKKKIETVSDIHMGEIDSVLSSAQEMYGMVNNLIHSMRVLFEKEEPGTLSIRSVLEKIITRMGARLSETNTRIILNDLPVIQGIQSQIELLLYYLFSITLNSISIREGHILSFSSDMTGKQSCLIRCEFQNSAGMEIKPENFRGKENFMLENMDDSNTQFSAAICSRLVAQYSGKINYYRIPEYGIIWEVALPYYPDERLVPL
ncbi:MAG: substrate-binding domain-containing protein [Spirochaetales bacterium]|nr:substrate-binding domain-containing protein [Spirochaetales bacterium]